MTVISYTAEQIIDTDKDGKLIFNKETVEKILLNDRVKDKPVCVVSIAGDYRGGKSFLLNFLLKYLQIKYTDEVDVGDDNWLQKSHENLNTINSGFQWRSGSERHTKGILMWPEVFLAKVPSTGEEIAIVLLDTQGTFDNVTSITDNGIIFALSTLVSSVQIYNLKGNIKNYDFDHLQCFSEYGHQIRVVNKSSGPEHPFQNLMFLIRDWSYEYDYAFGSRGGNDYVEKCLSLPKNKQNIKELFENVRGFLMPHPGLDVATSKDFDGNLEVVDKKFKKHVQELAVELLRADNLKPKMINGDVIKAHELSTCFSTYFEIFRNGKMPEIHTICEANILIQCESAVKSALQKYNDEMNTIIESEFIDMPDLNNIHNLCKKKALKFFETSIKMNDEELHNKYKEELIKTMDESFIEHYNLINGIRLNTNLFPLAMHSLSRKTYDFCRRHLKKVAAAGGLIGGTTTVVAAAASPTVVVETIAAGATWFGIGAATGSLAVPIAVASISLAGIMAFPRAMKWVNRLKERQGSDDNTVHTVS